MLQCVHKLIFEFGGNMPKENLKETVAHLEKELNAQRERNEEILQKLYQLQDQKDEDFKNSPYCRQLERDLEVFKRYKELYKDCDMKRAQEHDENVQLRTEIQKLKSERDKAWSELSSMEVEKNLLLIENQRMKELDSQQQVARLSKQVTALQLEVIELKKQKGIRIHNERNAGRKQKMTFNERDQILKDRDTGMTIKALSAKYGYSVGTIHKLISENKG